MRNTKLFPTIKLNTKYTTDYEKRNDNLGNNNYNRLPIEKILLITTYMFVTTVVSND